MSPFIGKKKAEEVLEENLKKAEDALAHGKYKRALEHIQRAGEFAGACQLRQEELVRLWDLNGRILDCLGRYEEALSCYDKAVSINPENALSSHLNRLVPLVCLEKWHEVVKQCNTILAMLPEYRDKKRSGIEEKGKNREEEWSETTLNQSECRVWTRKGVALSCLKKLDEALECYDKALGLDQENVEALVNKAHAYGCQGKFEEMSIYLLKAYNVHNKKFMRILPPSIDPDHFMRLLKGIADDWKESKVPINVSWHQCPICTRTSALKIHATIQYERNSKAWTQEFAPPLCRSMTNGIARVNAMEKPARYEEILGILSAIWTHAWKPNYRCHLIFTNRRLIIARMGLLRELLPYLDVALGAGVGTFVGGAAGAGAGAGAGTIDAFSPVTAKLDREMREKLRQISPEEILKSHKRNFDVSYSDIVKIQVGKKLLTSRLYIHTPGLVHRFKFELTTPEKVESSIRSLIAGKVHIERVDQLD